MCDVTKSSAKSLHSTIIYIVTQVWSDLDTNILCPCHVMNVSKCFEYTLHTQSRQAGKGGAVHPKGVYRSHWKALYTTHAAITALVCEITTWTINFYDDININIGCIHCVEPGCNKESICCPLFATWIGLCVFYTSEFILREGYLVTSSWQNASVTPK